MALKYKVGDKVRIKSLDWYNENKNENGNMRSIIGEPFIEEMSKYCGLTAVIKIIIDSAYKIDVDNGKWCWTDEMFEGLVEEENENMNEELRKCMSDFKYWIDNYVILSDGYIFKDENGNVINATKIVLEKKKKEYPKTYEECCEVMGIDVRDLDILDNMLDTTEIVYRKNLDRLLNAFRKLLICRDAYWKIAGEEMGLGKPWEPSKDKMVYSFYRHSNEIETDTFSGESVIFEFPTEEMRDAFKENFKKEIEICKELL